VVQAPVFLPLVAARIARDVYDRSVDVRAARHGQVSGVRGGAGEGRSIRARLRNSATLGWHDHPDERFHAVLRGTETLRTPGDAEEPSGFVEAATRERLAASRSLRTFAVDRHAIDYREREQHLSRLLGPVQRVEFGTKDVAGAQTWVTTDALAACVRGDIESLLAEVEAWRARDVHGLLQVVYNPRLVLEFDRLEKLFAPEAMPVQVLDDRQLIHFNPARLESFGNP
jgi:hypothetical protein